ncbi:MAG: hypothetical protein WEB37_00695 [Bacteroidota bacterium]
MKWKWHQYLPVLFLILPLSQVIAQTTNPSAQLNRIDSLLISGSYEAAEREFAERDSLSSLPDSGQYRTLFQRIIAVQSLPDTLIQYYAKLGKTYPNRYLELHAGAPAAACYAGYLEHVEADRPSQAYAAFLVADFLRLRYMALEKDRLFQNIARTRAFVNEKALDRAETLIVLFKSEPPSTTFRQYERDLSNQYLFLQEEIDRGKRIEGYELSRVEFERTGFASFGTGLEPFLAIPNSDLDFFLYSQSTRVPFSVQEGEAISQGLMYVGGEAGLFVLPTLAVGIPYYSGSVSSTNIFRAQNQFDYKYRLRVEYVSAGVWARYYFDRLTGGRPFVGVTVSSNRKNVKSESSLTDPNAIHFDEHDQGGLNLSATFGMDYVPSSSVPIIVSLEGRGNFATGKTNVFSASSFHVGLRAGVLF